MNTLRFKWDYLKDAVQRYWHAWASIQRERGWIYWLTTVGADAGIIGVLLFGAPSFVENTVLFALWFFGVVGLIGHIVAPIVSKEMLKAAAAGNEHWYHWLADIVTAIVLAGTGHFILAAVWLTLGAISYSTWDKARIDRKAEAEAEAEAEDESTD